MSFIADQVRRIDAELDKLQPTNPSPTPSQAPSSVEESSVVRLEPIVHVASSPHITQLQATARILSTASSSRKVLSAPALVELLHRAQDSDVVASTAAKGDDEVWYEREIRWIILAKVSAQVYGLILQNLLDRTIPLTDDIWYWEQVISSNRYTGLYSIQTSPIRGWAFAKEIYYDVQRRLRPVNVRRSSTEAETSPTPRCDHQQQRQSITQRWSQFYSLVRESLSERSVVNLHQRMVSPLAASREDARSKQKLLIKFRELSASGIGVLMDEGLKLDIENQVEYSKGSQESDQQSISKQEWKAILDKSISLMETVLRTVPSLEVAVSDFEDTVFSSVEDDSDLVSTSPPPDSPPPLPKEMVLLRKLQLILDVLLPEHRATSQKRIQDFGRPSRLIRYWLPATALLLSSSTILRILIHRKAAIMTWVREAGQTVMDFWFNWVVGPIKKIIGTIRHDEDSEVAIMSKRSLEGDRESLERMVVDFAVDDRNASSGSRLSDAEIVDLRSKVKEGDLTPVLKAYEKDLRKPFWGTVRGELIRALLIQIQKTKVDVEVAIGGIDTLLKSQELVFGFVGLTPGVLVCVALSRWLGGALGGNKGLDKDKRQSTILRTIRNVDRLLRASTASESGMLSYKDHGLLLCEVQVLRQAAMKVLPKESHHEFLEDLGDLLDIRTGVKPQLKVLKRIRWAYGKWFR
ncbi:MAG: C-4 sterol methyl oxidase [Chaenotheca gracillima]|nr:MAG: C-4 sterol methyl oxidase [Chaenotheca gracillima]